MKKQKVKAPSQKKIILTIRATKPAEVKALNELKDSLGEKTYAGALMKAATIYKQELTTRNALVEDIRKKKELIDRMSTMMNDLITSQKAVDVFATKELKMLHKPYQKNDDDD